MVEGEPIKASCSRMPAGSSLLRRFIGALLVVGVATPGCRQAGTAIAPTATVSVADAREASRRRRDRMLLQEFAEAQRAHQSGGLSQEQYRATLAALRSRELASFEEARNTQFRNPTEGNDWTRGG